MFIQNSVISQFTFRIESTFNRSYCDFVAITWMMLEIYISENCNHVNNVQKDVVNNLPIHR